MGRFVVLEHEQGSERHFDLMLERGGVLATFSFDGFPAATTACRRLFDHRLLYLDFEGDIGKGRGKVRRVESGRCELSAETSESIEACLEGGRLKGRFRLEKESGDRWTLVEIRTPAGGRKHSVEGTRPMAKDRLRKSKGAFERAKRAIAGGVNSPVRAFAAVGGTPPFVAKGLGSHATDIDGNDYIDFVMSWGPLILGHAHPKVVEAVQRAARDGSSFGAPTERETSLAEEIKDAFPSMELLRLTTSGTEAVMSAIRLARAFTARELVIKFDGCYHGHGDSLLVKAGSGATTFGHPSSPGVPEGLARLTVSLPYNDAETLGECLKRLGDDVAAVIIEPVAANMGVVAPAEGFLEALRELTQRHGVLLIFDEVVTGFRIARGGAQERFGVAADITVLGKIIGGGFPIGCFGGRRDIMRKLSPLGPVYQAGTLSGNPIATAAGLATLRELRKAGVYRSLERKSKLLFEGLTRKVHESGIGVTTSRVGSMMTVFFAASDVSDYENALRCDTARFARFHAGMLARGVYLAPSQFEAVFVSTAHTDADIRSTVAAAGEVFAEMTELS